MVLNGPLELGEWVSSAKDNVISNMKIPSSTKDNFDAMDKLTENYNRMKAEL